MQVTRSKKMNSNPIVTAIIAAYNEEIHLADCIDSLLNQSYNKMEIIIVENGESKDRTYDIAKEYASKCKNVRAFSIPGKQKGPGNAWNFGIKKAKGKIILTAGADLRYGRNYVKEGIKPIVEGKTIALVQDVEICNNIDNWWARAFFNKRITVNEKGLSKVFSLVSKDYIVKRPFNSALGYADDQTIYMTEETEFPGIKLEVYHTNPASLKDTWDHSLWVGKSLKTSPWKVILILPIFPFYALYKTINHLKTDFYLPFILFLPFYYSVRYFAYLKTALGKII